MSNYSEFLTSKVLSDAGVRHGWFMRYGGVSGGLFESLNGKKGNGDTNENVDENRSRALAALCHPGHDTSSSCSKKSCLRRNNNLTHIIHEFKSNVLIAQGSGEFAGYDASIARSNELVLSQTTADCGTVVIADTNGVVVSLVHGSWHTLAANIISETVAKIRTVTSNTLIAGIGPMVCKNCYEFGAEAKDLFDPKYLKKSGQKYHVDLKQMILDQLKQADVNIVDDVDVCTLEDERFFSHRRDGAQSGRFLTLAKCK